jgi:3-methyladenine DNA glycosylase/8-oxoguanine DNA glycosylase
VSAAAAVQLRVEVRPRWVFELPLRGAQDGLTRVRGGVLHRLLDLGGEPVLVRVAQPSPERVLFAARAASRAEAEWAIERMRLALGVDQDLRPFHERFRFDPLIGRAVRAQPGLRVTGKPEPFEALAWAICEQLIEFERAAAIERRLVARLGHRCGLTGLRSAPTAAVLARQAPARLASLDLSAGRAALLVRVAREVAAGRINLHDPDHERGWRRLRALRGIGSWTVQMLGLTGQGRLDQLPAGDVGYLKLVGRLRSGDPYGRATEEEVGEFFAPYHPWAGLAGAYALWGTPATRPPAGTRASPTALVREPREAPHRPHTVRAGAGPHSGR